MMIACSCCWRACIRQCIASAAPVASVTWVVPPSLSRVCPSVSRNPVSAPMTRIYFGSSITEFAFQIYPQVRSGSRPGNYFLSRFRYDRALQPDQVVGFFSAGAGMGRPPEPDARRAGAACATGAGAACATGAGAACATGAGAACATGAGAGRAATGRGRPPRPVGPDAVPLPDAPVRPRLRAAVLPPPDAPVQPPPHAVLPPLGAPVRRRLRAVPPPSDAPVRLRPHARCRCRWVRRFGYNRMRCRHRRMPGFGYCRMYAVPPSLLLPDAGPAPHWSQSGSAPLAGRAASGGGRMRGGCCARSAAVAGAACTTPGPVNSAGREVAATVGWPPLRLAASSGVPRRPR